MLKGKSWPKVAQERFLLKSDAFKVAEKVNKSKGYLKLNKICRQEFSKVTSRVILTKNLLEL